MKKIQMDIESLEEVLNSYIPLGQKLALVRKYRGLTQRELCKIIGMSQAQYTRYESDKDTPRLPTLINIASGLDCVAVLSGDNYTISLNEMHKDVLKLLSKEQREMELYKLIDKLSIESKKSLQAFAGFLYEKERSEEGNK